MAESEPRRKPNRLINEKSPYLQEHAFNLVDWYPWGEEALARAKNDGKPILLSIGYSTCHWCHVLARESFDDASTAALINKNFIPIKVDREERPELDAFYMSSVQTLTGQGGWPLTVFLTPDLKPFYGGTYFPPEPRYGMPSFKQVLTYVSALWKEKREEVVGRGSEVVAAVQERYRPEARGELRQATLDDAYDALVSAFDDRNGGFGGSPKFPLPSYLSFLLRYHYRTKKPLALSTVTRTLDAIDRGGIHDHLGGGFHRYATDRIWLVPHFEKMLYDNALLATAYTEAALATGELGRAQPARDALGWMLREMRAPEGGFYSAQDADTKDGEGVFYTWRPEEVSAVIGKADSEVFDYEYGVTSAGNFEGGRSILNRAHSNAETASKFGMGEAELTAKMGAWKKSLYEARTRRPRPNVDKKILTSWNGLAISAFANAGEGLQEKDYLDAAERAAWFILESVTKDGRILRRYADGEARLEGTVEDYSFFVQGLLDLFEASHKGKWLEEAIRLAREMVELFWDDKGMGFFFSQSRDERSVKEGYDGPTPSGNSVAAVSLLRISELTGDDSLRQKAELVLKVFNQGMEEQPTGHTKMLTGLDLYLNGMNEVVITARSLGEAEPFAREFESRFIPDKVLVVATESERVRLAGLTPLLEGRSSVGAPTVYVCKKFACLKPIVSVEELRATLAG